jgi:hypothetical protein
LKSTLREANSMFNKFTLLFALAALLVDTSAALSNRLHIPPWYQCHRLKNSCEDACVDTKTGKFIYVRVC